MRKHRFFTLLLCLVLAFGALPAPVDAADDAVRVLGSGTLGADYYAPTSGTPISGCDQVVAVGDQFFVAMMTAKRQLVGYWFSQEGQQLRQMTYIADLSKTTGNLSQPSVCQLNGTIYVGWVVIEDEADNDVGGAQYICTVKGVSEVSKPVCVCAEQVWPRRPAMAAGDDGVLLVYRAYQDMDDFYGYQHQCYATYVREDLTFSTPYRVNVETHNSIYPSVAWAKETGRFLIAWSQNGVTGAVVTKETRETPENFRVNFPTDGDVYRPCGVASNGREFLVTAFYQPWDSWNRDQGGLWAVPVSADGTQSAGVLSVPLARVTASHFNNGQALWDGGGWVVSWSCEKEEPGYWSEYSEYDLRSQPDFRYTDCYAARLNAKTLLLEGSSVGLATGWWNQFHPRLALGNSGTLFCTYLDDSHGGTLLSWVALRGMFSGNARTEGKDGGVELRRSQVYYDDSGSSPHWNLATAFSGEDGTFWTWNGTLSRYAGGVWSWSADGDVDLTAGGKVPYACTAVGNTVYCLGWAGFGIRLEFNDALEEVNREEICIGDTLCTGVWAEDADTVWAVNAVGEVWRWRRGSAAERLFALNTPGVGLHAIHGGSAKDVWAVGDRGAIVHYNGTEWKCLETPVCASMNAVKADGRGNAWVCGDGGTVLRVSDGICTALDRPTGTALYDLSYADPDCVFVCGTDSAVYRWEQGLWTVYPMHRYDQHWDFEQEDWVDDDTPNSGAVFHLVCTEEDDHLHLIACSEPELPAPVYEADVPLPEQPMFQAWTEGGAVCYKLRSDVPEDARVCAARYEGGRMTGCTFGENGTVTLEGAGTELVVYLLDKDNCPLCEPVRLG